MIIVNFSISFNIRKLVQIFKYVCLIMILMMIRSFLSNYRCLGQPDTNGLESVLSFRKEGKVRILMVIVMMMGILFMIFKNCDYSSNFCDYLSHD